MKATLVKQEEVVHTQLNGQIESLLPGGSKYDYNNRAIHLPGGSFKMPLYGNSEPIHIVASRDLGDKFAFIMRPDGASHNRPVQQLMIHYRSKSGEELMNTIVSIPPAIDWRSGWGFDEATVKLTDDRIEFSFSGDKVHGQDSQEWADLYNLGQYAKRYTFAADLPKP